MGEWRPEGWERGRRSRVNWSWMGRRVDHNSRVGKSWIFLVAVFRILGLHHFEIIVGRVIPKAWSWRWWFEIELGEFFGFVTDGVVAMIG